jgi:hypothetical protein
MNSGTGENMQRVFRAGIWFAVLAIASLQIPGARAQKPTDAPPAPIPTQITAGKKVFIANAGGNIYGAPDAPELTYNEFYTAIKSWGRYELVDAPGDADLVFEIGYVMPTYLVESQLRLTILDPKTHVVLWALGERIQAASRQSTVRKNFDQAMSKLVNDVMNLVGQHPVTADSTKK